MATKIKIKYIDGKEDIAYLKNMWFNAKKQTFVIDEYMLPCWDTCMWEIDISKIKSFCIYHE